MLKKDGKWKSSILIAYLEIHLKLIRINHRLIITINKHYLSHSGGTRQGNTRRQGLIRVKMVIETFVFLDLETTGLISSNQMPKITELSLVAVNRNAILKNKNGLPRVLHKLVLPICPNKLIPPKVESLTNLNNKDLENVKKFDPETYMLIESFISRLAPPVCFVAHNGNGFDYPIFLWELKCINKDVNGNILCIDTLCVFKDYFNENQANQSSVSVEEDAITLLNDGNDKILCKALDNYLSKESLNDSSSALNELLGESCTFMQEKNEKTPKSQIIKVTERYDKHMNAPKSKKKLNFSDNKPRNFKLATIYKHMTGFLPENVHSAEADCLTMLRCVSQIKTFFIEWADRNAVPLIQFI